MEKQELIDLYTELKKTGMTFEEYVEDMLENKAEEKSTDYIETYRQLFPKGILPSGQAGRAPHNELKKKFAWFFVTYNYDWDTILEATKKYIEHYAYQGYKYMQTSSNFISKQDKNRIKTSGLAVWCEMLEEDKTPPKEGFDINV